MARNHKIDWTHICMVLRKVPIPGSMQLSKAEESVRATFCNIWNSNYSTAEFLEVSGQCFSVLQTHRSRHISDRLREAGK